MMQQQRISSDRICSRCVGFKDGWCSINQCSARAGNYGCRKFVTPEDWKARLEKAQKRLESQDAIRVNYMLTMMYTFLSSGMTLLERCEKIMDGLIEGKNWRQERKLAMKRMKADADHMRKLYARYFEKDFVDMMTSYGEEDFDVEQYDNFGADSGDFLRLALTFYEHCYRRPEDKDEAIAKIRQMPHDLNLFDEKFVETFRVK